MKLLLSILCVSFLMTQQFENYTKDFFHKFPLNTSIRSSAIHGVIEDSSGFVYISTKNGIKKFNGSEWVDISFPGNLISSFVNKKSFYNDKKTGMWVGTNNDVLLFKEGEWHNFTSRLNLGRDEIQVITKHKNDVVIGTKLGWLHRYNGAQFYSEKLFDSREITALTSYNDSVLMVGTTEGLYKTANNELVPINDKLLNKAFVSSFYMYENTLYVGTEKSGLFKSSGQEWELLTTVKGINDIHFSVNENRLWIGSTAGLLYLHQNKTYSTSVQKVIHDLYVDRYQNMWVSTFDGLYKYDPYSFKKIMFGKQFPKKYTSTKLFNNLYWIGSFDEGLISYSQNRLKKITQNNSVLPSNNITCLYNTNHDLWVGTSSGLLKIDKKNRFKVMLENHFVDDVYKLNDMLWVSSKQGRLFSISNNEIEESFFVNTEDGSVKFSSDINTNSFWGVSDSHIALYHDKGWYDVNLGSYSFSRFTFVELINAGDNSHLLVSTESGELISIRLDEALYKNIKANLEIDVSVKYVSKAETQKLYTPESDRKELYITSNKGIEHLTFNDAFEIDRIKVYNHEDGIPSYFTSRSSLFYTKNKLWLSSYDGLYVKNISNEGTYNPELYIIPKNEKGNILVKAQELNSDQNNITVTFELSNNKNIDKIMFRSQLLPLESEPTGWSSQNFRDLLQLPSGTFEYVVWAKLANGNVISSDAFTFNVKSPWWFSGWAYFVYFVLFIGLMALVLKYLVSSVERKNQELAELIEERTEELKVKNEVLELNNDRLNDKNLNLKYLNDRKSEILGIVAHDLKNPLTTIIGFTELLLEDENKDETKSTPTYLEMIDESAKNMKEIIYQILNAERIEHGDIPFKRVIVDLEEVLQSVIRTYQLRVEQKEITVHTSFVGDCHALVDEERMREVFDNLISNAIKYTHLKSNIWVLMSKAKEKSDAHITISIKDEGPGLTEDDMQHIFGRFQRLSAQPTGGESSTGLGLSIVKKFVEAHNGVITVESEHGKGATFKVKLPLF